MEKAVFPPTIFKGWLKKLVSRFLRVTKEIELERTPANTLQADG